MAFNISLLEKVAECAARLLDPALSDYEAGTLVGEEATAAIQVTDGDVGAANALIDRVQDALEVTLEIIEENCEATAAAQTTPEDVAATAAALRKNS